LNNILPIRPGCRADPFSLLVDKYQEHYFATTRLGIPSTNTSLSTTECKTFDTTIHLFATNILVSQYNKHMLKVIE
jgi:hypothetical protein